MFNFFRKRSENVFEREISVTREQRDIHLAMMNTLTGEIQALQHLLSQHTALFTVYNNMLSQMVNVGDDLDLIDRPDHLKITMIDGVGE